jgi:hypothetical protein
LDKDAGVEVARGMFTLGNNVGLGACVGALAGGVAKTIAKSTLPPVQKAGLIVGAGLIGAVLHTGASAINAQSSVNKTKSLNNLNQDVLPKNVNEFIDTTNNISPLEVLLLCITILNSINIWLIVIFSMQVFFKVYVKDKPELN